jgi:hypothetical protein
MWLLTGRPRNRRNLHFSGSREKEWTLNRHLTRLCLFPPRFFARRASLLAITLGTRHGDSGQNTDAYSTGWIFQEAFAAALNATNCLILPENFEKQLGSSRLPTVGTRPDFSQVAAAQEPGTRTMMRQASVCLAIATRTRAGATV